MARPTIKDLQNLKGKRKLVLTTAFDYYTARACDLAGIDVIVTWPQHNETMEELMMVLEQVRKGAPNTLIGAGIPRYQAYINETEALKCSWQAIKAGADRSRIGAKGVCPACWPRSKSWLARAASPACKA